jgi:hypothetical protein
VKRAQDATSTNWRLWLAFFAGPAAWTVHELLSYALVAVACASGLGVLLHVVTLVCLGLAGAGVWLVLRSHALRFEPPANAEDILALAAVLLNAVFAFAILMEGLPNVVVSPCL